MSDIINGTADGKHVVGQPLTTATAMEAAPELLLSAVDARITKIRPMSTPVDQISRIAGSRHADSMEVAFYSVDSKPSTADVTEDCNAALAVVQSNAGRILKLKVSQPAVFDVTDTVMFPDYKLSDESNLCGYVMSVADSVVNVAIPESFKGTIEKGRKVVRMGRAATELDVQSPQYQALPKKEKNYCQIFKMQVELSTLMKLADKEVGWNFSEQEEAAVIDMRLGMEKNFIFGNMRRIYDPAKNDYAYLTGGIWSQARGEYLLSLDNLKPTDFIEFAKAVFTGNNGSRKRLLIGGSDFVAAISKLQLSENVFIGPIRAKWGLETREIVTNFGSLYIIYSEVFDQCGHSSDAMVLDQAFITKYTHIPFHPERLNLRAAGTRNTDAVVLTEASCLVLRNPNSHFRVLGV